MAVDDRTTEEALEHRPHPHDIGDADLRLAQAEARRPDLLEELVAAGRSVFGFFPAHYPHTLNYPWVLERLEMLAAGSRVLDVGAGVSPLPIVLARRGLRIECIDKSSTIRTMPAAADWNEWGFFDYSAVDARIRSYHCDARDYAPGELCDRVYSVSVLAHMSGTERGATVARIAEWLKPGGRLLLAVDLLPKSDFLWNRSEGVEVERPTEHGTIDDLVASIEREGLRITERAICRTVYASRTDLLFIEAAAQG